MTQLEFATRLDELDRARDGRHARLVARELRIVIASDPRWLDAALHERAARLFADRGLLPLPAWQPAVLPAGETYLLLYEPVEGRGHVLRLRAVAPGAAPATFTPGAEASIENARHGLLSTAARACRALPEEVRRLGVATEPPQAALEIDGGSLGLSVCAALLSHALQRAPRAAVAGTARVGTDGTLRPVDGIAEKTAALRRAWPSVTTVIVAEGQEGVAAAGIRLQPCRSLADALVEFGLDLGLLEPARIETYLDRVRAFETDNVRANDSAAWRRLAWLALEAAEHLSHDERNASTRALGYSALFSLHAGDVDQAHALLKRIPDEDTAPWPGLHAWKAVIAGAARIDDSPQAAVALAREALDRAHAPGVEPEVLGQALGTLGRALLHAGHAAEAEEHLARAVAHFRAVRHREVPRSLTYLATCLRHLGRTNEALTKVEQAIEEAHRHHRYEAARTTLHFLALEQGRCLLELGRPAEAIASFERVRDAYPSDADYPRTGAVRGLAAAHRALGDLARADEALRSCIDVARADSNKDETIRKVAAMAIGDALLAGDGATNLPRRELEEAWRAVHPDAMAHDQVAAIVERWIY